MELKEINRFGRELKEILNLKTSPVAVGLAADENDIPQGMEKIGESTRHCQMVDNVRRNGSAFYTILDDHQCKGGAAVMGMSEMGEKLKNGEFYFHLNHFGNVEAARKTMEKVPYVTPFSVKSIMYAPLEQATFIPDIVVIVTTPRHVMELSQALLHTSGGRIHSSFAGKQSLCGDGVALPYTTGEVGVTVGCSGSRKYTQIVDEEMIISIPVARLPDLVSAAGSMFN